MLSSICSLKINRDANPSYLAPRPASAASNRPESTRSSVEPRIIVKDATIEPESRKEEGESSQTRLRPLLHFDNVHTGQYPVVLSPTHHTRERIDGVWVCSTMAFCV